VYLYIELTEFDSYEASMYVHVNRDDNDDDDDWYTFRMGGAVKQRKCRRGEESVKYVLERRMITFETSEA